MERWYAKHFRREFKGDDEETELGPREVARAGGKNDAGMDRSPGFLRRRSGGKRRRRSKRRHKTSGSTSEEEYVSEEAVSPSNHVKVKLKRASIHLSRKFVKSRMNRAILSKSKGGKSAPLQFPSCKLGADENTVELNALSLDVDKPPSSQLRQILHQLSE